MKKLITCMLPFAVFCLNCAGLTIGDDQTTRILIRMAAVEVVCEVQLSQALELDLAFRSIYEFAKTGQIPKDVIDQLNLQLAKAFDERPTLGLQIANLASLIGFQLNPDGSLLGFGNIPPEILEAMAGGYNSGFKVCAE